MRDTVAPFSPDFPHFISIILIVLQPVSLLAKCKSAKLIFPCLERSLNRDCPQCLTVQLLIVEKYYL